MFKLVCDDEQIVYSNFLIDDRDREIVVIRDEIIQKSSEDSTGN